MSANGHTVTTAGSQCANPCADVYKRQHFARIQTVDAKTLALWSEILDSPEPLAPPMVYTVNSASMNTLRHLASATRIATLNLQFSRGWDESIDRKAGRFIKEWGPTICPDAILQGSHLGASCCFYKSPNRTLLHNTDWTGQDLSLIHI